MKLFAGFRYEVHGQVIDFVQSSIDVARAICTAGTNAYNQEKRKNENMLPQYDSKNGWTNYWLERMRSFQKIVKQESYG